MTENYKKLVETHKEYVGLLATEMDNLVELLHSHNYKASEKKIKEGKRLRDEIEKLEKTINWNNLIEFNEEDNKKVSSLISSNFYENMSKRGIIDILNNATDFELISFYFYPSCTRIRLLEQMYGYKTPEHDFLEIFGNKILDKLEESGKRYRDNKIVIEFKPIGKNNEAYTNLYLGYHDDKFSIGLEAYQYDGNKPISIK